jgi:heme/copper-type cytochrome/quinol oxidase subunit 2
MKKTLLLTLFYLTIIGFWAGCRQRPSSPAERVKVVMKKYRIDPPVIRVKSGDTVELEVSTVDVQHGLDIPQLGIKEAVQPGKPAIITFIAPAKGEYQVTCGILCGPHHDDMQARLVVE